MKIAKRRTEGPDVSFSISLQYNMWVTIRNKYTYKKTHPVLSE